MSPEQIVLDIGAVIGAIGVLCSVLAHLPFPPKWAERFARFAAYAANTKFSINQRQEPPPPRVETRNSLPLSEDEVTPVHTGSALFAFLFAIGFAFHASACAPAHSAADVPHDVAIAYAAANVALEVADSAETAYLDSLASPTQDQLDRAASVVAKLQQARGALVAVHDDLQHGRDQLLAALADLRQVVALSNALGVKIPDKVDKSLSAATEVLQ